MGDFAVGLLPDFGSGAFVMGFAVAQIIVLIAPKRVWDFGAESARDAIIGALIFGFDVGGANDDFGAEGLEHIHFFLALLVGRGENTAIAAHASDEREAHSGIAGGTFDDGATGFEQAIFLGIVDHFDSHPVLDGVAGIEGFDFGEYEGGDFGGQFVDFDEGGIADGFEDIFLIIHIKSTDFK